MTTIIGQLLENLAEVEQRLEISDKTAYNEENTHKYSLQEKKKKWVKPRWIKVSNAEMAAIESKIRQGECHDAGEHCVTVRSVDYCYLIEILNAAETPEYYVLVKEHI